MIKAISLLLIMSLLFSIGKLDSETSQIMQLTMFDVGQGDSFFIKSPDHKYMLIDTGNSEAIFRQMRDTLPGRVIDLLVISHGDLDHGYSLLKLIDYYQFKHVLISRSGMKSQLGSEIINKLGSRIIYVEDLSSLKLGCCIDIDLLWPMRSFDGGELSTNDGSIAFLLKFEDKSIFMSGDLSKEFEQLFENKINDIDIFKVGHHGSKTSTPENLIGKFKPEISLISVGEDNTYGHPSSEVLTTLKHTQIYRTDEDGPVRIDLPINSKTIKVCKITISNCVDIQTE